MKFVIIIAIAFVLFSSIFVINSAFAQSYTGVLKLDSIPSNVKAGGIITFSGTLTTTDGRVVQDATIYIKDDVDFDIDTVLGTVTTDESGKFSADWKAVTRSSGSYDFYAVYEGGGNISSSRSVTQTVNVLSSETSSSSSYSASTTYTPTKIILDRFINSAKTGEIVTFSGKLTANGQGLSGKTVWIKDEDALDANDKLISTITDAAGKFSVNWKVRNTESGDRKFLALVLDFSGAFGGATQLNYIINLAQANTVEIYAEFEGNNQYSKSNTCLIENVDGVSQQNCNNKILSIQDDSSFENLIMSMVLSEMGVDIEGTNSLESILSNQADSTDFASFEGFLLDALQDELDLGDTDLSMQEMVDLLEDPSLAVNYNTVQSDTPITVPEIISEPTCKIGYVLKNGLCVNAGTIPTTTDYDTVIKINKSIERLTLLFNELSNITHIGITAIEIKNVEHLHELNSLKNKIKQIDSKLEIVKENYKIAQKKADQKHYTSSLQILTNLETSLRVILDDYYSYDRDLRNLLSRDVNMWQDKLQEESTSEPEELGVAPFVDESKDPKDYVKRYVTEESYKTWFEENYPEYSFHEALGITKTQFNNLVKEVKNENSLLLEKPQMKKQQCGDGTELVNGICQLTAIEEEEIVEKVKQKFCFLWWCW